MASVPRPLIALLVATVAAFALWTVALKPGSSAGGSANSPSAPVYQSAIAKAHQAAAASAKASAADGAPVTSGGGTATHAQSTPAVHADAAPSPKVTSLPSTKHPAAKTSTDATKAKTKGKTKANSRPAVSEKSVLAAISAHKVLALLFYNPAAPDDTTVARELSGVSTYHGQAATFAVPVSHMSQFGAITAKVPVDATPTLIFIDKHGRATSLVGFVDRFEITQRVSQALTSK